MPRTPPWLETTTMRPRPAARIDGQQRLGERHRAEEVGAKHLLPQLESASPRRIPTAAMPALCTSASGAPTASIDAFAAAAIDAGSSRSSRTPIKRGSSAAAPVAARSAPVPRRASASRRRRATPRVEVGRGRQPESAGRAGDDDAARLSHPDRLRTVRRRRRLHVGPPVGLGAHPGGPDAHRVRPGLPSCS